MLHTIASWEFVLDRKETWPPITEANEQLNFWFVWFCHLKVQGKRNELHYLAVPLLCTQSLIYESRRFLLGFFSFLLCGFWTENDTGLAMHVFQIDVLTFRATDRAWFPYDRGSEIAKRSTIVCDHMETYFCDRLRSWSQKIDVLYPVIVFDQLRSNGNQF